MAKINDSAMLTRLDAASDNELINRRTIGEGPSSFGHERYSYDRESERGSHLRDYWLVIRKRIWLIIGASILLPTLVAIILIRQPDIYESQARIQVDLENANPLLGGMSKNSQVILNGESNDPAYFNTQLQILTGPGLLRKAAENLDLEHNKEFLRDLPSGSSSLWTNVQIVLGLKPKTNPAPVAGDSLPVAKSNTSTTAHDLEEAERLADYVEVLQRTLTVEPVKESRLTVRETRLIDITYRHPDPRLAAKIVNTVAQTFVDENFDKRTETSGNTGTYLQKRIAELQSTIRAKEEELINYAKNHQILSLDANQNTVVERLEGLNKQLLVAENERKLAEASYKAGLQPGAAEALAEGGNEREVPASTKLVTEAQIKLAELRQKREELLVENTEKWPAVKEIDKQIVVLEKQIKDARGRATTIVTTNLGTRYRQALATEEALRKAYDQQRAETLTQNEAAVNYRIIQQEIETNKSLLDGLLQRTKENDVVMAGTPNNIRVVDYAIPQKKPVGPRRTLFVGMAFLFSLCCGVALAFFIDYLDDTIRSSEDIENFLHLPSVASIPLLGSVRQRRLRGVGKKNGAMTTTNGNGASNEVLLIDLEKHSPVAEAYRHLRTSILLSTAGRAPRTLLITSSVPSEGKTTTAVNSAISLAQTGARVLIIDADMRRPRLHNIFNLSNVSGLSELLSREIVDGEIAAAIQHSQATGLFVLTAGPMPPNPAELIGSEQMLKLISRVTLDFTHVVIDSPPVAAFTDGVLIASMVDGVLLVVHSGRSSRKIVSRARKLLQDVGARIIGVVLNKTDSSSHGDYYYNAYYSHYHGEVEPADESREAAS